MTSAVSPLGDNWLELPEDVRRQFFEENDASKSRRLTLYHYLERVGVTSLLFAIVASISVRLFASPTFVVYALLAGLAFASILLIAAGASLDMTCATRTPHLATNQAARRVLAHTLAQALQQPDCLSAGVVRHVPSRQVAIDAWLEAHLNSREHETAIALAPQFHGALTELVIAARAACQRPPSYATTPASTSS